MKGVVEKELSIYPHQHSSAIFTSKTSSIDLTSRGFEWRVVQLARKLVWQMGNEKKKRTGGRKKKAFYLGRRR